MQPYFFPYIGYFQLMNAVDEFVVYDNIKFSKKGWINRNRILVNGKDSYITIPIQKDSDFLDVRERHLAEIWGAKYKTMLNRIISAYRKAPFFDCVFPIVEKCIIFDDNNLFNFIFNSLSLIKDYLEIKTHLLKSSLILINHDLKAENKVIAICKSRNASFYLNPIGGVKLYCKDRFKEQGIDLHFIKTNDFSYTQFNNDFVPFLSIIDVMMFNSKDEITEYLYSSYTIV